MNKLITGAIIMATAIVPVVNAAELMAKELALVDMGAAKFKGVCNGDATSLEVFTEPRMTTFHGQLVVVLEPTAPGPATLTIKGGGMASAHELFCER